MRFGWYVVSINTSKRLFGEDGETPGAESTAPATEPTHGTHACILALCHSPSWAGSVHPQLQSSMHLVTLNFKYSMVHIIMNCITWIVYMHTSDLHPFHIEDVIVQASETWNPSSISLKMGPAVFYWEEPPGHMTYYNWGCDCLGRRDLDPLLNYPEEEACSPRSNPKHWGEEPHNYVGLAPSKYNHTGFNQYSYIHSTITE